MADETVRKVPVPGALGAQTFPAAPQRLSLLGAAVDLEVGAITTVPNITRGGVAIPEVALNPSSFDFFSLPQPKDESRIIAQTPAAGSQLPRGSKVDLILAPRGEIVFDVFQEPHVDFHDKTLAHPVMDDPEVHHIVQQYSDPAAVPAADRTLLLARLQEKGITVKDDDPQRTFERAFKTLRNAEAFR
jgi:hypothetical protein